MLVLCIFLRMRGAMCFDFCWYKFTNLEVFVNMAVLCLCSLCAGKHGSFVCVCVCALFLHGMCLMCHFLWCLKSLYAV